MICSAKTDIGLKRSVNQDAYGFKIISEDLAWAIVCDGMGGMAAGNIASEIAADHITNSFSENLSPKLNEKQITTFLKAAVESANAAIYEKATNNDELKGMGTTVVCAVVKENICFVAHAGDSRLYLFRDGTLIQMTSDHSVVQSMVDNGHLTEEEAKSHPNKNIITRALGVHKSVEVDITDFNIKDGDVILLCSDGLTNCVEDSEIVSILNNSEFERISELLIDKANSGGGIDNITAVALKI